ncbi:MAG: hypothetical protein RR673_06765 [Erysipelotrichaceae bacterium]
MEANQFSGNLELQIELLDSTFTGFAIGILATYDKSQTIELTYNATTKIATLPYNLFSKSGYVYFSIYGVDGAKQTITTTLATMFVGKSNTLNTTVTPSEAEWQALATRLCNTYITNSVEPRIKLLNDEAIAQQNKAKEQQTKATTQQTKIDASVANMGQTKVENGKLFIKKADGTWSDPILISGQTNVLKDNVVQSRIDLSTTRTTPTQTNTVLVQLKDTTGKLCMVETVASQVFVKVGNDSVTLQRLLEISVYTEPPIAPKV